MGCNSCSNITLPGNSGPAGADGGQGPQGPIGNTGPAGASVSVLDVDFTVYTGAVPSFPIIPQKSVTIPADIWENEHDIVELEMMFQAKGKVHPGSEPLLKIKVGPMDVDLYSPNPNNELAFSTNLNMSPALNNIIKVKVQLPMFNLAGTQGTIRPVLETDVFRGTSNGQEYYSISSGASSIYGRSDNSFVVADVTASTPIEVYMMHSDPTGALPFNMVYYKLLSYKKIV